jgi:hypothetical protein
MVARKDANRDAQETKQAALLLAEAMDRLQQLFVETTRAHLGRTPPIDYEVWYRRKEEAYSRRHSAAEVVDRMVARVPDATIESPDFRLSSAYLFYVASRRGLARQFSAVDIMHSASMLLCVAQDPDDTEPAAETAEHANELGQYALLLLQAAPTLRTKPDSAHKMEVLVSSLEKSYEDTMVFHRQALAAFERIAP